MSKRTWLKWSVISGAGLALLVVVGCNPATLTSKAGRDNPPVLTREIDVSSGSQSPAAPSTNTATSQSDAEHGHKAGAHGGIMVSLGRDSYHVEAVVDSEGTIRLYTLGKDETRVVDVESQTLKGFVKAEGDSNSKSISFEPSPQDGDEAKKTSLFIGKLPSEFVGRKFDVTIPNIHIAGERFRLGFQSGQEFHSDSTAMPDKLASAEEQELYLTPGGRYTAADVTANGKVTASQKFKGIKSAHNMNPEPGERTCPISGTKANPKFTWIVDGKPYQFCCPPCVDEFVKAAKLSNDPLPEPDSYIKK